MQTNLIRIAFGLPDNTLESVDAAAKRFGVSRSRVVAQFVKLALQRPEAEQRDALLDQFELSQKESV